MVAVTADSLRFRCRILPLVLFAFIAMSLIKVTIIEPDATPVLNKFVRSSDLDKQQSFISLFASIVSWLAQPVDDCTLACVVGKSMEIDVQPAGCTRRSDDAL